MSYEVLRKRFFLVVSQSPLLLSGWWLWDSIKQRPILALFITLIYEVVVFLSRFWRKVLAKILAFANDVWGKELEEKARKYFGEQAVVLVNKIHDKLFNKHEPFPPRTTLRQSGQLKRNTPYGPEDGPAFGEIARGMKDERSCYLAVIDRDIPFVTLRGRWGSGKTSFLRACLEPLLKSEHNCIYVKFDDLDPIVTIRQAVQNELSLSEDIPIDVSLSDLLSSLAQSSIKPVVLLLDQFEAVIQKEKQRRLFTAELKEWSWRREGFPVTILFCVFSDFYEHLSEMLDHCGYSVNSQNSFALDGLTPKQAAEFIYRIAEKENRKFKKDVVEKLLKQQLANQEDGFISPVYIQIFAWMVIRQEEGAFDQDTLRKLGGIRGVLEEYLRYELELCAPPSKKKICQGILQQLAGLTISERRKGITSNELAKNLKSELETKIDGKDFDKELKNAISWLVDERLIKPSNINGNTHYKLDHDSLITAWKEIERTQGDKAEHAKLLLDRRLTEWMEFTKNRQAVGVIRRQLNRIWEVLWNRSSEKKYLLNLRELWLVKKHLTKQELKQGARDSFVKKSESRLYFNAAIYSLPLIASVSAFYIWRNGWGQPLLVELQKIISALLK